MHAWANMLPPMGFGAAAANWAVAATVTHEGEERREVKFEFLAHARAWVATDGTAGRGEHRATMCDKLVCMVTSFLPWQLRQGPP